MTVPNFEALRAERNAKHEAWMKEMAADGWSPVGNCFDPNACYCGCASGGPCEHDWTGPEYTSEDGCLSSATCALCGMTAFSHSMRFLP